MARTSGPLMSLDASGSVAGTLVYAKWKGRSYVRQLVTPSNPKSVAQYYTRSMMTFLSQAWAALTGLQQGTWDAAAKQLSVSPFNAFVRANMMRWTQAQGPSKADPATGTASPPPSIGTPTTVGGVRQITGVINVTATSGYWGHAIQIDASNGATPGVELTRLCIRDETVAAYPFTISNLTPGTYSIGFRAFNDVGYLDALTGVTQGIIVT